jgi:hypothetical protein
MPIPLPYRILIALVFALAAFGSGSYIGYQYAQGRVAQELSDAKDAALEAARRRAESDLQDAVERVRRETLATERARNARSKGVNDATAKANPRCDRDDVSHGLLVDAINAANGSPDTARSLPEKLRQGADTSKRVGQGDSGVGIRYD